MRIWFLNYPSIPDEIVLRKEEKIEKNRTIDVFKYSRTDFRIYTYCGRRLNDKDIACRSLRVVNGKKR